MDLNFEVFQEPRGLMRVLHLVFSISAFASISEFSGTTSFSCTVENKTNLEYFYLFDYPFKLNEEHTFTINETCHPTVSILGNFVHDAQFFVATGVLAMLYCLAIIIVYAKFDKVYKTNSKIPLVDFIVTVIFGVLWLSSSAAWANGLTGLKHATDPTLMMWQNLTSCTKCSASTSGFSTLNISVVLGFLNFFLWAADLWFVYKETEWFQSTQGVTTSGV